MSEAAVDYDDYDPYATDTGEPGCMSCRGEGIEECETSHNSEGCWERNCNGYHHTCSNCGGSGDAKDQRYW